MPSTISDLSAYGHGNAIGQCREDFPSFPAVASAATESDARMVARYIVERATDRAAMIYDALAFLLDASRKAVQQPSPDALSALIVAQENAQDEIDRVEDA